MPLKVWNGSSWTSASGLKVWNGSSWASASNGYVWNGSAWVPFFSSERVRISNQTTGNNTLAGTGGTAVAAYGLTNFGTAYKTNIATGNTVNISGEWLISGVVGDYEVKGTWSGTGGIVNGPTTFSSLSTTREFTLTVTNNSVQRDLTVEIRDASTLTVLDTAVISFTIDSAP